MPRYRHELPGWWIEEGSAASAALLEFLNGTKNPQQIERRFEGVGAAPARELLKRRPSDGYKTAAELLDVPVLSLQQLETMLVSFASPGDAGKIQKTFARLRSLSKEELALLLGWTPRDHRTVLDFVNRAGRDELRRASATDALSSARSRAGGVFEDLVHVANVDGIGPQQLLDLHGSAGTATLGDVNGPFDALDEGLPVAMLPVRIEATFAEDALRIRIFPDVIHADAHHAGLTADEETLGKSYWTTVWRAGSAETPAHAQARADLAAQLGAHRAAWVAAALKPANPKDRPEAPVQVLQNPPRHPTVRTRKPGEPVVARLLPDRWVAIGYTRGNVERTHMFTAHGKPIPENLPMAPDFLATDALSDDASGVTALLDAQELSWTYDYAAALDVGMAITVPFDTMQDYHVRNGIAELFVVGIRDPHRKTAPADELEALLTAHRFTEGLAFVPQGTPTNNTDFARSGVAPNDPDVDALFAAEVDREPVVSDRPTGKDGFEARSAYRRANAWQAGVALGLPRSSVLDRTDHADDRQSRLSWRMNQCLWPITWGRFFEVMFDVMPDNERGDLRQFFVDYLRGGGPLPCLRMGEQPVGILPVSYIPPFNSAGGARLASLRDTLGWIIRLWWNALLQVAHLDPNATDVLGTLPEPASEDSYDDAVVKVAQVLGAVPHPTDLVIRNTTELDARQAWNEAIAAIELLLFFVPASDRQIDAIHLAMKDALEKASDVLWEIEALKDASGPTVFIDDYWTLIQTPETPDEEKALATDIKGRIDNTLVPLAQDHQSRIPFELLYAPSDAWSTRIQDDDGPKAFVTKMSPDVRAWRGPLVTRGGSEADLAAVKAWLSALLTELDGGAAATTDLEPQPLLFQLLRQAVLLRVGKSGADFDSLRAGLEGVLELLDESWMASPPASAMGELERAMGETLGLAMHRLDAWYTGVAAERLAGLRQARPTGIQVGGYGFVVDLKKRDAAASQGFVHAPSLDHAATAAVLRSGFAAFGASGQATSTMATDLSSERIRRARWILDGLRAGQTLHYLLGARFERRMHDEALDRFVYPIRQAVLKAADDRTQAADLSNAAVVPARPANDVVDGLTLSRAYSGASDLMTLELNTKIAVDATIRAEAAQAEAGSPSMGAPQLEKDVKAVLADLAVDIDAVADATLAQSVHSVLKGNTTKGTATLSAMGSGDAAPPQLTFAKTLRGGSSVTERVCIVLPAQAQTSQWHGDILSWAEPHLEGWLSSLLPSPGDVVCRIDYVRHDTVLETRTFSLLDLKLSALTAVHWAAAGETLSGGRLESRLAWAAILDWPSGVPSDARLRYRYDRFPELSGEQTSVEELRILARELRRVVVDSQPLTPVDLQGPVDEPANIVADPALITRASDVRTRMDTLRTELETALAAAEAGGSIAGVVVSMNALSAGGFPLASSGRAELLSPSGDPADRTAVLAEAHAVLRLFKRRMKYAAAHDAKRAAKAGKWSGAVTLEHDRGLLRLLAGRRKLPILARVDAPNAAQLAASFGGSANRLRHDPTLARGWLDQVGRVRERLGAFSRAIDVAEALADRRVVELEVGQLPHHEADGWVAIEKPSAASEPGTRASWLAQIAFGATFSSGVTGLVVDRFVDTIPGDVISTGVAIQFDAPGARAPQAILLLGARPDKAWDMNEVVVSVRQVLDLARLRAVGPQHLETLGQLLPAIYMNDDTDPGARGDRA